MVALGAQPLRLEKKISLTMLCPHNAHTVCIKSKSKKNVHKRNMGEKRCNNFVTRDFKMLNKSQVGRYKGKYGSQDPHNPCKFSQGQLQFY